MVDYQSLDDSVLKQKNQDRVTSVERLEDRSWDRDNIEKRLEEVQNNADTIETILQDIEEQLNNIPSGDELRDEWETWLDRIPTDSKGNAKSLPRAFYEAERDRFELMLREAIWQARLKELERFARKKLSDKFLELLEDYRVTKSESKLEDILDVQDKVSRMETMVNQIEKMGQSFREDKRSLWTMMERVAEEDTNSLTKEDIEDAMEEGLDEFVKSNGVFTLDEQELEQDRSDSERESAAESAAENTVGSSDSGERVFELKGKSVDEQYTVLTDLREEHEPVQNDMNQAEVAELTDVTPAAIFKDGGILDRIHDEDMFPGVDVRGD